MVEKKGIDLIKKVAKNVIGVIKELQEAKSNDEVISRMEWIGLGDNIIALGSNLLQVNELIAEIKDVDTEEAKELVNYIISLGVGSDKVQIVLLNTVALIEGEIALYHANVVPIINALKK